MPSTRTLVVPYNLELGPNEDKKHVIAGPAAGIVPGKMLLSLTATVEDTRRQAVKGAFDTLFRYMMGEQLRKGTGGLDWLCYGSWDSPSAGSINLDNDGALIVDGDLAIAVSGTFPATSTHMFEETYNQMIAYYLEHTAAT